MIDKIRAWTARGLARLAIWIWPDCKQVHDFYAKILADKMVLGGAVTRIDPMDMIKRGEPDEHKDAVILWGLLDDIDTASDMFKPRDPASYEAYFRYVDRKCRERHKVFESDGYHLFKNGERVD